MREASNLGVDRSSMRTTVHQPIRAVELIGAAAIAAFVLGSAGYAQAYDYVDSRGYRHWCHQASCGDRKNKVADENDLSWEPPPGVEWQMIDNPSEPAPRG